MGDGSRGALTSGITTEMRRGAISPLGARWEKTPGANGCPSLSFVPHQVGDQKGSRHLTKHTHHSLDPRSSVDLRSFRQAAQARAARHSSPLGLLHDLPQSSIPLAGDSIAFFPRLPPGGVGWHFSPVCAWPSRPDPGTHYQDPTKPNSDPPRHRRGA